MRVSQRHVVDAHQVQDRGVQVVDVQSIDGRMQSQVVGLASHLTCP